MEIRVSQSAILKFVRAFNTQIQIYEYIKLHVSIMIKWLVDYSFNAGLLKKCGTKKNYWANISKWYVPQGISKEIVDANLHTFWLNKLL